MYKFIHIHPHTIRHILKQWFLFCLSHIFVSKNAICTHCFLLRNSFKLNKTFFENIPSVTIKAYSQTMWKFWCARFQGNKTSSLHKFICQPFIFLCTLFLCFPSLITGRGWLWSLWWRSTPPWEYLCQNVSNILARHP